MSKLTAMIEVIFHFILVLISFFFGGTPNAEGDAKSYQPTCQDISSAISSKSAVYYPGEPSFVPSELTLLHVCGPQEVEVMRMVLFTGVSLVRNHLHVQSNRGVQRT